jgi:hypothetical protein
MDKASELETFMSFVPAFIWLRWKLFGGLLALASGFLASHYIWKDHLSRLAWFGLFTMIALSLHWSVIGAIVALIGLVVVSRYVWLDLVAQSNLRLLLERITTINRIITGDLEFYTDDIARVLHAMTERYVLGTTAYREGRYAAASRNAEQGLLPRSARRARWQLENRGILKM